MMQMHDLRCIDIEENSSDFPTFLHRFNGVLAKASIGAKAKRVTRVDPLTQRSSEQVYLVNAAQLATPDWASWRTKVAAANRYFVVVGDKLDTTTIVQACRDGAYDVIDLTKDDSSRWPNILSGAAQAQELWWQLYGSQSSSEDNQGLIGRTPAMKALRLAIQRLGPTRASVLILGESGTGKERVAEALHQSGGQGEFVAFNCAAIPAALLEAELFGVTKGAFTGASADRPGLVEQANGGTLFLDEIGEMDPAVQPKLLRFLETRQARRLGSNTDYKVDLRVVAATNRDLTRGMATQEFRSDLFFRLAEITLDLVPLRERLDDLPLLAQHFLDGAGTRFGKFFDSIEPELLLKFRQHHWPGNVRELKNTMDRLVLMHDGPVLRENWWDPPAVPPDPSIGPTTNIPAISNPPLPQVAPLRTRRDRLTRARELLAAGHYNLAEIAAEIGVHSSTLFRWRQTGKV
ncbi:MAG: hypothetical protein SynsKO_00380 [Synoicihabitans sp.]